MLILDRLRSGVARSAGRNSFDSQWDMASPVGSPSCSSPYPSSSHLSSCSSDPSLPTTNLLSPRISSSSNTYLERRRGSVQLPTVSARTLVNFPSPKRRFNKTHDSSTEESEFEENSRKKLRLRRLDISQIDGGFIEQFISQIDFIEQFISQIDGGFIEQFITRSLAAALRPYRPTHCRQFYKYFVILYCFQ